PPPREGAGPGPTPSARRRRGPRCRRGQWSSGTAFLVVPQDLDALGVHQCGLDAECLAGVVPERPDALIGARVALDGLRELSGELGVVQRLRGLVAAVLLAHQGVPSLSVVSGDECCWVLLTGSSQPSL